MLVKTPFNLAVTMSLAPPHVPCESSPTSAFFFPVFLHSLASPDCLAPNPLLPGKGLLREVFPLWLSAGFLCFGSQCQGAGSQSCTTLCAYEVCSCIPVAFFHRGIPSSLRECSLHLLSRPRFSCSITEPPCLAKPLKSSSPSLTPVLPGHP